MARGRWRGSRPTCAHRWGGRAQVILTFTLSSLSLLGGHSLYSLLFFFSLSLLGGHRLYSLYFFLTFTFRRAHVILTFTFTFFQLSLRRAQVIIFIPFTFIREPFTAYEARYKAEYRFFEILVNMVNAENVVNVVNIIIKHEKKK